MRPPCSVVPVWGPNFSLKGRETLTNEKSCQKWHASFALQWVNDTLVFLRYTYTNKQLRLCNFFKNMYLVNFSPYPTKYEFLISILFQELLRIFWLPNQNKVRLDWASEKKRVFFIKTIGWEMRILLHSCFIGPCWFHRTNLVLAWFSIFSNILTISKIF